MYNAIKNKMTSFLFHNFGISSYELVSKVDGKEELYRKGNKVAILILDEETGKRIFDVVKSLKEWGETITSDHVSFKVTKYVADKNDTIQILFAEIDLNFENDWERSSKLDKLQELISFVYAMQEKGYLLDSSSFNNETCRNISDFLSFFKPNGFNVENSNSCIVKYVHYVLSSGGDFDALYQPIVAENKICCVKDFPYYLPVIEMCYNYCAYGNIPDNIKLVVEEEKRTRWYDDQPYHDYLVVCNPDMRDVLPVTEETAEYTVYDKSIKIYKEMSSELEEFLEDKNDFLWSIRSKLQEDFENVIVSIQGKIIGYKFSFHEIPDSHTVLEKTFKNQQEILLFVSSINKYLMYIRSMRHFDCVQDKKVFDLEKDLIVCNSRNNEFRIAKMENLFNFITDSPNEISISLTTIFFKLLLAYLEKTYGKASDKSTLFEKKEVRYLSPIVAREFVNFALGKQADMYAATVEFHTFICNNMVEAEKGLIFDCNFQYNPSKSVPFIFDYEVESKYGIKLEKGMEEKLSDNRTIVTFKRRKSISSLKDEIESVKDEIHKRIGYMNDNVKLSDISEIIYSTDLASDNMYLVAGYVKTPVKGVPLTDEFLMNLNNKEMLKVAGRLMSNFGRFYISNSQILVDVINDDNDGEKDFVFYIDILDNNFQISRSYSTGDQREFVQYFFNDLKYKGYNPNAFVGIDLSRGYSLENHLVSMASRMDAYCEDHKIYYDGRNGVCPVCAKTLVVISENTLKHGEKVFEDQYAIHYRVDWKTCVKVYKQDSIDMKKISDNIDFILSESEKYRSSLLGQECFIPCKKALNSDRKFIGYTYDYESFNFENDGFSNLKDAEKLENLPRIMSLVRLILQVKSCLNNDMGFVKNPFGNVYLSKNHKKQVQIVNVEFFKKHSRKNETVKWLYKYICQVLDSDTCIEINTNELPEDLDYIVNLLKDTAKELTMYCPVHRIYYRKNLLFCPKCVDSKQFEKIKIEYTTAAEIAERKYFNQGGESTLYYYDNGGIAKVFKDTVNYTFKCNILSAIFAKKEILERINGENHKFKFIIPKSLLVDRETNKILGYIMDEKVEGVSLATLRDKVEVRNLGFYRKDVFEILITAGEGIQTLHDKANIYIGDLNGRNILVDTDKNVYFLDFDGMGVENIAPTFCTEGYIDPVSQKNNNITKKDDWYSFAIQAFYYLTFTHPFNGIYEESGKSLDIPDKMERRLSLLGRHRIKVPAIAESWDWMNSNLEKAFLNIFEGDSRKSIVPELKKQYCEMYGGEFYQAKEEKIQINSKFVAEKNDLFEGDVVRVINNFAAICRVCDEYVAKVMIRGSEYNIAFPNCMEIVDVLMLKDYAIAFAVYRHRIVGFMANCNREIFSESFNYETEYVVVNKNTLYLAKNQYGENIILQVDFGSRGEENHQRIKFMVKNKTLGFLSMFNSKFMLIKQNSDGEHEIYCNSEKLCNIENASQNSKYNILYDDVTKLWLVIDNKGNVITINSSNGHRKNFRISEDISDTNVRNASFSKGILYIPSTNCLYIIDVKNQMSTKRMECNKIMTPDSHLYNFNSNGFSVVTSHVFYNIHKA